MLIKPLKKLKFCYAKEIILLIGLLFIAVIFALNRKYLSSALLGIKLWSVAVLPALFPYFFITALISKLKITSSFAKVVSPFSYKTLNISGTTFVCLILSLLAGYPTGAKLVADFYEQGHIQKSESVRASILCSTSSPMFLIGSVGGIMFNSVKFGVALFLTHFIANICLTILFCLTKKSPVIIAPTQNPKNTDCLFYESVYSAVISVLMVGGIITLFSVLSAILLDYNILTPLIKAFTFIFGGEVQGEGVCLGFLELTSGIKSLCSLSFSKALPLCAVLSGFGGFSIIMQSVAYLKKAKIKTTPFLFSKVLSAVFNYFIGLIVSILFF